MTIPISSFLEVETIDKISIREGSPCKGRLIPHSSPEAKTMLSQLKRIQFLIKETNRIRDLFGTDFSSKAPKHIFDDHCNKLFNYQNELDVYDKHLILHECE